MKDATPDPVGFIVIAEVALGRPSPMVYGEEFHATIDDAAGEISDIAVALGIQGRGCAFLVCHQGQPVGVVVTSDDVMWLVQAHAVRDVILLGSSPAER